MTSDLPKFLHQGGYDTSLDNMPDLDSAPNIDVAHICARKNTDSIECAAPTDLVAGSWRAINREETRAAGAIPYCLDIEGHRSIYVGGISPERAQSAAFYYLTARREAQEIYAVPWKSGPVYPRSARPVFIFSPGRCGSTLLSRLLFEAKIPTISEPDFYTQFTARALYDKPNANFYATEVKSALESLTYDMATVCGAEKYFVIKLRSEVCFITRFLVNMFPEPRKTIFMFRDFEGWARSILRHFGYPPQAVVSKYVSSLNSLATLSVISACHIVSYDTLLARPHDVAAALGTFLEAEIPQGAVERALGTDAQKDTPLAQDAGVTLENYEDRLQQAIDLWNKPIMANWHKLLAQLKQI